MFAILLLNQHNLNVSLRVGNCFVHHSIWIIVEANIHSKALLFLSWMESRTKNNLNLWHSSFSNHLSKTNKFIFLAKGGRTSASQLKQAKQHFKLSVVKCSQKRPFELCTTKSSSFWAKLLKNKLSFLLSFQGWCKTCFVDWERSFIQKGIWQISQKHYFLQKLKHLRLTKCYILPQCTLDEVKWVGWSKDRNLT